MDLACNGARRNELLNRTSFWSKIGAFFSAILFASANLSVWSSCWWCFRVFPIRFPNSIVIPYKSASFSPIQPIPMAASINSRHLVRSGFSLCLTNARTKSSWVPESSGPADGELPIRVCWSEPADWRLLAELHSKQNHTISRQELDCSIERSWSFNDQLIVKRWTVTLIG